jgi:GTP pyrophosphokinase
VLEALLEGQKPAASGMTGMLDALTKPLRRKSKANGAAPMPIRGLIPGMALHFAKCCHPIPGDRIVGIVTTGKGITIHVMDCETLENYADAPERWIDVAWDTKDETTHIGRIRAYISHEPAALATVTQVIAKELGNISNLKIAHRSTDFFEIMLDIEVRDVRHLNNIIANLRSKEVVQSVERWQS